MNAVTISITAHWDMMPRNVEVSADVAEEPDTTVFRVVFIHHLKDGGSRCLRNVSTYPPVCIVSHP